MFDVHCERPWVEIDTSALEWNARCLKSVLADKCEMIAVLKADAYGHGAELASCAISKASITQIAVFSLEEGAVVRDAGFCGRLLLLGPVPRYENCLKAMINIDAEPTLSSFSELESVVRVASQLEKITPVHVKIDTGLSRLGIQLSEVPNFLDAIVKTPTLRLASIYSHLASGEFPDDELNQIQISRFQEAIVDIRESKCDIKFHIANTAAMLAIPETRFDYVRIGLGLYGVLPWRDWPDAPSLKPVMSVKSRVLLTKWINEGEGIGYGSQLRVSRRTRLAIVAGGYADGIPTTVSNRMEVTIGGRRAKQLGRIAMNQMVIDVTDIPEVEVGEVVTLLGGADNPIDVHDWCEWSDSIPWEVLTRFGNARRIRLAT